MTAIQKQTKNKTNTEKQQPKIIFFSIYSVL